MQESRLYSFLDSKQNFTVHFLEGQKIIADLVQVHNLETNALTYYRETLLSSLHMLHFLKPGELLGFYIDSEEPYFRFKLELNSKGDFRTLLLPEAFDAFPEKLTGICRVSKIYPNKRPYSSATDMRNESAHQLVNIVLKQSYQTNSQVITSEQVDQSVMFTKLPPANVNMVEDNTLSLSEYIFSRQKMINDLFSKVTDDIEVIVQHMELEGLAYLGSKQVKLTCSCSKERMISNLVALAQDDLDHLFEDKESVEVRCDYCNTVYQITKEDLNQKD